MVSGVGQVGGGVGVLRGLLEELPDAQPLVLGYREVLDSVTVKELLLATDEVLQEVDGVALERCQEGMAVNGEEMIPTVVVSMIKGTYTSRLELYLAAKAVAVMRGRAASLCSSTIIFNF